MVPYYAHKIRQKIQNFNNPVMHHTTTDLIMIHLLSHKMNDQLVIKQLDHKNPQFLWSCHYKSLFMSTSNGHVSVFIA